MIQMRDDVKALFPEGDAEAFLTIDGEVVKHVVASRRIISFERGGRCFFMKQHYGVGWAEIFKNLFQFKLPVIGAEQERSAIEAFGQPGVEIETATLAAWGKAGWNPAHQRSFIITDALFNTQDLESYLPELARHPDRRAALHLKRAILNKVGDIARRLHGNGMNHRDFYLCHFRIQLPESDLPDPLDLHIYLMDLHRVQIRATVPHRWVVKDIAGLLFSALYDARELPLTRGDILRFIETYTGLPWRDALVQHAQLWRDVIRRIKWTYQHDHGRLPVLPRWMENSFKQHDPMQTGKS